MQTPESVLQTHFGYDHFRKGQKPLIDAILSGRDALGILPTGAGKSICYQVPALMLPGLTVVISPLISLMQNQVGALRAQGIDAVCLHSGLSGEEWSQAASQLYSGRCRLLYLAPERLDSTFFARLTETVPLSLIAVDEAHCISQWGQDFRPQYLAIADCIDRLPVRPVVAAFTATATPHVRKDIVRLLHLRDPVVSATGFDRPNLFFEVLRPFDKTETLLQLLRARKDRSGIIYCATRRTVESICDRLRAEGFGATRYHAGLTDDERRRNQEDFLFDRAPIMVATNAFGMGIDKSDVSFVIHYNMPKNLESYYQEAGRAGRDGMPADCILLYSEEDVQTARFFIEHEREDEPLTPQQRAAVRRRDLENLSDMAAYCLTDSCLRAAILRYFGETPPPTCTACGNCMQRLENADVTIEAQKIVSCVFRLAQRRLRLDRAGILAILKGEETPTITRLSLHTLSTYGICKADDPLRLSSVFDELLRAGFLGRTAGQPPLIMLTRRSDEIIRAHQPVFMSLPIPRTGEAPENQNSLYETLRRTREQLARRAGVPPYFLFSNRTLAEMARRKPEDFLGLLAVPGVNRASAERYQTEMLTTIRRWLDENPAAKHEPKGNHTT